MAAMQAISATAAAVSPRTRAADPVDGRRPPSTMAPAARIQEASTSFGGDIGPEKKQRWVGSSTFWGRRSFGGGARPGGRSRPRAAGIRAGKLLPEKLNLWELLGGRGLKGGEMAVNTEAGLRAISADPEAREEPEPEQGGGEVGREREQDMPDIEGFQKEMTGGLVGGFPGGEIGLNQFLDAHPPPPRPGSAAAEMDGLRALVPGPAARARTLTPPLLMPGMTVIVSRPDHPFHNFGGIVQRVTDGRAGVLFEGGNWDKLVTFRLQDLRRTSTGPPMSHPKSFVLLEDGPKS